MINNKRATVAPTRSTRRIGRFDVRLNQVSPKQYELEATWSGPLNGAQARVYVKVLDASPVGKDVTLLEELSAKIPRALTHFVSTVRKTLHYTSKCNVTLRITASKTARSYSMLLSGDSIKVESEWSSYKNALMLGVELETWPPHTRLVDLGEHGDFPVFVEVLRRGFCFGTSYKTWHFQHEDNGKKLEVVSTDFPRKEVRVRLYTESSPPSTSEITLEVAWYVESVSNALRYLPYMMERALKSYLTPTNMTVDDALTPVKPKLEEKQKVSGSSYPIPTSLKRISDTAIQFGLFDDGAPPEELLAKLALVESMLVFVAHSREYFLNELLSSLAVTGDLLATVACLRGAKPSEVIKVLMDPLSYLHSLTSAGTVVFSSGKVYVKGKEIKVEDRDLVTIIMILESLFA